VEENKVLHFLRRQSRDNKNSNSSAWDGDQVFHSTARIQLTLKVGEHLILLQNHILSRCSLRHLILPVDTRVCYIFFLKCNGFSFLRYIFNQDDNSVTIS